MPNWFGYQSRTNCTTVCGMILIFSLSILSAIVSEARWSNVQSHHNFSLKSHLRRMIISRWPAFHCCTWPISSHLFPFYHDGVSRGKWSICASRVFTTRLIAYHFVIFTPWFVHSLDLTYSEMLYFFSFVLKMEASSSKCHRADYNHARAASFELELSGDTTKRVSILQKLQAVRKMLRTAPSKKK